MGSKDLLLHVKNAKLLVAIKGDGRKWYASSLAREAGLSYVHAAEVLDGFARDGLVELKKEGKIRRATLTESGMKIALAVEELLGKLGTEQKQ